MSNPKYIKTLSVAQPWAECIVSKGKNVENRSWNTKKRGYIAIHASAAFSKDRFNLCKEEYNLDFRRDDVSYGMIVGFAEILDVITEDELSRKTSKWFMGEYGFVLGNIIKLKKPIRVKGSLGFWKLNGRQLNQCLAQLSIKNRKILASRLLD